MIILETLLYTYVMWVLFLAVMSLYAAWKTLPLVTKILAVPAVLIAVLMDVGLNIIATVPFLDLPQEWTFSQRMGRYKRNKSWRTPIACWFCSNLLDPFQVGGHCSGG
jgi:hypothetical protein